MCVCVCVCVYCMYCIIKDGHGGGRGRTESSVGGDSGGRGTVIVSSTRELNAVAEPSASPALLGVCVCVCVCVLRVCVCVRVKEHEAFSY